MMPTHFLVVGVAFTFRVAASTTSAEIAQEERMFKRRARSKVSYKLVRKRWVNTHGGLLAASEGGEAGARASGEDCHTSVEVMGLKKMHRTRAY